VAFSHLIGQRLAEIEKMALPIKMIATSTGSAGGKIRESHQRYKRWATNATTPKIIVVYETCGVRPRRMARRSWMDRRCRVKFRAL